MRAQSKKANTLFKCDMQSGSYYEAQKCREAHGPTFWTKVTTWFDNLFSGKKVDATETFSTLDARGLNDFLIGSWSE